MTLRKRTVYEDDEVLIEQRSSNGVAHPPMYLIELKVANEIFHLTPAELFPVTEALAKVCNDIEDRQEEQDARAAVRDDL